MSCTPEALAEVVARYGGLDKGVHAPGSGAFCILEARARPIFSSQFIWFLGRAREVCRPFVNQEGYE